jgi:hypothetical protein
VRQRIATSENVEPVTSTACAAPRRTPSSAAAATSRHHVAPAARRRRDGVRQVGLEAGTNALAPAAVRRRLCVDHERRLADARGRDRVGQREVLVHEAKAWPIKADVDPSVGGRFIVAGLVRRPERGGEVLLKEVRVGRRRRGGLTRWRSTKTAPPRSTSSARP